MENNKRRYDQLYDWAHESCCFSKDRYRKADATKDFLSPSFFLFLSPFSFVMYRTLPSVICPSNWINWTICLSVRQSRKEISRILAEILKHATNENEHTSALLRLLLIIFAFTSVFTWNWRTSVHRNACASVARSYVAGFFRWYACNKWTVKGETKKQDGSATRWCLWKFRRPRATKNKHDLWTCYSPIVNTQKYTH